MSSRSSCALSYALPKAWSAAAAGGRRRGLTAAGTAAGALLLAATLLPAGAGAFCGFFVSGADAAHSNNASQVVLLRKGSRTVMSMSNNYKGPPQDFAMVVPVPVVLQKEQVKTLAPEVFKRVDQLSAPRLVEYWEQDPCYVPPPPSPRRLYKMSAPAMASEGAAAPT